MIIKTQRARTCILTILGFVCIVMFVKYLNIWEMSYHAPVAPPQPVLDFFAYNKKMLAIANYGTTTAETGISATSTLWTATTTSISSPKNSWPVSTVYPNVGALLPFNRIVAYYGNFYSKAMGILGEYPPEEMISKLEDTVAQWRVADAETPVIPALDYIAVTAQKSAGDDGKYRLRMPADQIEKAISLTKSINGLLFLDVQVGLSDLQTEIPLLEPYLRLPFVQLAIDPEFSMKTGAKPGTVIGTFSSADINYAATYLAKIVREHNLPPKILVIHRFTEEMVTDYKDIKPLPEVQIVIHMDGWGDPKTKSSVYTWVVQDEPVQFAGIKIFYKHDARPPSPGLMTPADMLKLKPQPVFIQYQ